MLKIEDISSGYGKKQVLYNVNFGVKKGSIVLLTGGNGSGKSTVFKCIYNLLPLWSGDIWFNNRKISGLKTNDLIRLGLVYIPQKNNIFDNLTVKENLEVSGSIYKRKVVKEKMDKVFERLVLLKNIYKRTPFNLSAGERQFLAFGMALMHDPKLILFDEPIAGVDQLKSELLLKEINKMKLDKVSLFVIEHKIKKLILNIDDMIIMNLGRIQK